jgi:pilus assembly protein CpaE
VPNRQLASEFASALERSRSFQILAELDSYPSQQTLEVRLRQTRADVVLVDLATNLEAACDLIRCLTSLNLQVQIVGLHMHNDAEAILRSLRMGASEFLYAPFDQEIQNEAVARLHRLLEPAPADEAQPGAIVTFSSTKPGSGASTLAAQIAFALRRGTSKRVLLADFDLMGGMVGFYLKLTNTKSLLDALQSADQFHESLWPNFVTTFEGVDVLAAPETPYVGPVDAARLHTVLEHARMAYDWVVVDLPVVFQRISLMSISESDRAFLVTTAELPSLHLARKAINLLEQLGFPKERFQIMINRIHRRDEITGADIGRLFNCAVNARIPNDHFSLHRAVTLGQPVDSHSELGKAIYGLAAQLSGRGGNERKKTEMADWRAVPSAV